MNSLNLIEYLLNASPKRTAEGVSGIVPIQETGAPSEAKKMGAQCKKTILILIFVVFFDCVLRFVVVIRLNAFRILGCISNT